MARGHRLERPPPCRRANYLNCVPARTDQRQHMNVCTATPRLRPRQGVQTTYCATKRNNPTPCLRFPVPNSVAPMALAELTWTHPTGSPHCLGPLCHSPFCTWRTLVAFAWGNASYFLWPWWCAMPCAPPGGRHASQGPCATVQKPSAISPHSCGSTPRVEGTAGAVFLNLLRPRGRAADRRQQGLQPGRIPEVICATPCRFGTLAWNHLGVASAIRAGGPAAIPTHSVSASTGRPAILAKVHAGIAVATPEDVLDRSGVKAGRLPRHRLWFDCAPVRQLDVLNPCCPASAQGRACGVGRGVGSERSGSGPPMRTSAGPGLWGGGEHLAVNDARAACLGRLQPRRQP